MAVRQRCRMYSRAAEIKKKLTEGLFFRIGIDPLYKTFQNCYSISEEKLIRADTIRIDRDHDHNKVQGGAL